MYNEGWNRRLGRIKTVQYSASGRATHYKVQVDDSTIERFLSADDILGEYDGELGCERGSSTVGSPKHSHYCPKYKETK